MLACSFCDKGFIENMNGLIEKTFHELEHHPTDQEKTILLNDVEVDQESLKKFKEDKNE
jgi:hypothetical protein